MIGAYRNVLTSSSVISCSRRILHKSAGQLKASVEVSSKSISKNAATPPPPPPASFSSRVASFAKEQPFVFQLVVATGKTSAADLVCQTVAEGKKLSEIDWTRNALFVVFGATYLGGFQYWIMVTKYRQWFPTMDRFGKLTLTQKLKDTAGLMDAGKMILFDIFIHLPMMYFPSYYTVKEFIYGQSWNPMDWARDGVTKYIANSKEDLTAMVQLWGPSDCIQFALPTHIRMPFRHMVSFFWTAYVSFTRGSNSEPATE
mmetsp:Transcript_4112/g.8820  ORF Transcript_4112/g.8820 Transcript_4112/m.8820 type:complete len:258 (-) Transcript_4112:971-1744(-)|eukprot:CAMPEP_0172457290 /NCGR_PEP_ID=MMETSP1065-20121228/21197_1 /TAXON_ID=265537 /ORGANISM="Amphiprora paludosa, Strain CCMP125" /LENGTH=257 /DNA_ID=CAMNT_0013210921 /DNA_START=21 /DNA_END=794 /DNA_ORIENTATION=-